MNTNKITKAMRFEEMKSIFTEINRADLVAFCEHEMELLAKKNTKANGEKKLTSLQEANEVLKTAILDGMTPDEKYTITSLIKEIPIISNLTNQKVSALVRQLVANKMLTRTEIKGVAYFTKV